MHAPLFPYGAFGEETSLVVAFLIGIGFGAALERAGFGSARKLVAQFYLTDLAVFKVMFTAILTAMLGVMYLGWMGVLDLSLVYLTPTYVLPQITGGVVLGAGFIIGGYCPGTSIAGAATGRFDGLAFAAGMVAGAFIFGALQPAIGAFFTATALGQVTIPSYFHLPYGGVVFAIVLVAVAAFYGASRLEQLRAGK
jgi:uncharacterized protein